MKFKKDSLLFKTILYNDLSMLLTGITIITLVIIFVFRELEKNFSVKAVDTFRIIESMLEIKNDEFIRDLIFLAESDGFIPDDMFEDDSKDLKEYLEIHNTLKEKLNLSNFSLYNKSKLSLMSNHNFTLDKDGYNNEIRDEFLNKTKKVQKELLRTINFIFYDPEEKIYYNQIFIPVVRNKNVYSMSIQIPLDNDFFNNNKCIMIMNTSNVKDVGFYTENEPHKLDHMHLKGLKKETFKYTTNRKDYTIKTLIIKGLDYNIISQPLYGYDSKIVGYLVLSMSEPDLSTFKKDTMLLIILAIIILILLNTFIINETFKQLLMPLEELSLAVDDIANGNLDRNLRLNGTSEIKLLSLATKKMVEKLKTNSYNLEEQNDKLKNYIDKVQSTEKLLLMVKKEQDSEKVIDIILKGFTSETGLNYDRAIFFAYSHEEKRLVGKKIKKSRNISKENKLSSFDLTYETMKEIVPLIKIKNDNNLFNKAITDKKIIFRNIRGYKIYLGSELLMGFGLNNFMILPIFNENENIGCILVDNYISGRRIESEDIELFNMILLTLGIHYQNEKKGLEKINAERNLTIGDMFEKIIYKRNEVIEKHIDMVMKLKENNSISPESFLEFRDSICKIRREDSILFDYSDKKEYNFEKLKINKFLTEIAESYVKCNANRNISLFLGSESIFLGDPIKITKVFREIINNSLNAIETIDGGQINIICNTKGHNIIIKIWDNGIGISKNYLKTRLFEPFSSQNKKSSGLGLAIANKIITNHKGLIDIKSKLGEYTEVRVILNKYKDVSNS